MARESSGTPPTVSLEIGVKLASAAALQRHRAAVYAFARSGQLIDKIATEGNGHVRLQLPDLRVSQEVRIMVGPDTQAEQSTVAELARRGAQEQFVRILPASEPPVVEFDIQPALSSSWLRRCLVRGTLRRRHGAATDAPIAGANVQIWEIEPIELMIAKLPDAVIEDFRDLLSEAAGRRGPEADGLDPVTGRRKALRALRLQSTRPLVTTQMRALMTTPHFTELLALAEDSAARMRDHLVRIGSSVRLLLCLLYPAWIRKHLLANAATDAAGGFRAQVFPSSHCPSLNLYFTASTAWQGTSVPVYDPRPVASFTHWEFQSGTEVALIATSEASGAAEESPARDATHARRAYCGR
jgi:hypothetical protein